MAKFIFKDTIKSNLIPLCRYYIEEKHCHKKNLLLLVHKPYDR